MHQQAQELMQLHRTVGHRANLLEAQPAPDEAQWLGIMMWMQEREQKSDARHEDEKLWGASITNIIAKVMNGVSPVLEVRMKERGMAAKMDGGGLESSRHAVTTQE